ncbi:MAG: sigma 54-interacting transcriptional regulator, partial [Desulfovibrionaceae bacterium]|nr:sigma 54-interacting transcriptional regulator [Desulfovibrionaceae bacterium]
MKNTFLRDIAQRKAPFPLRYGLTGQMLLLGLPLVGMVFLLVFFSMSMGVEAVLQRAIARNAQLQAQAMSLGLEQILAEARNQLLILTEGSTDRQRMMYRLRIRAQTRGLLYREVAFMALEPENRYLYIIHDGKVIEVPDSVFRGTPASPFHSVSSGQKAGQVSISQPQEVVYPLLSINDSPQSVTLHVVRLSTPVYDAQGTFRGVLCLSLDLKNLRNAMSLYSAPEPPFSHEGTPLRSFFFDREGWLLFQAEPLGKDVEAPLASDRVRAGFSGDFGRPGFSHAFRPGPDHVGYWSMTVETQAGRSGQLRFSGPDARHAEGVSFAPVSFAASPQGARVIIGGLAILDDEFSMSRATGLVRLIYAACCAGAMLLLGLCLWWLARKTGGSLALLAHTLQESNSRDDCAPLPLPPLPGEVELVRQQADVLLKRLGAARENRQSQEREQWESWQREPVDDLPRPEDLPAHGLIGQSPPVQALVRQIRKTAQIEADVLIIGETGTGKELVAESIHRLSARAAGPCITINCGALDEALLMDTLFGHVRGAFTEAKQPRKGAFLAAEGGTLM